MADAPRARKLAERIQVIVASMLETRIKDPRLGFVTVTDTRVTNDLQQATIFYTVMGGETQLAETAAALESAKGVLRSEVGKQIGIRLTPTLTFIPDALPETAHHMDILLREVAERDAELARTASGALPAGDADPYRVPRTDDDDALGEDVVGADEADGEDGPRAEDDTEQPVRSR